MPNAYVLNQVPTTYGQAYWLLINMLLSAGWTAKASGDGLSAYSSSGSVFSNGGAAGANGFGQTRAWIRLQDPSGVREFVLQHDNAGGARIKYSANAKFTGGAGSATVTPSATDERYIRGATSDATPSYGATFLDTGVPSGLTKFQGAAMSASPYGFWFAGATTPAGGMKTGLMLDAVDSAAEDTDPYVWHVGSTGAYATDVLANSSNNNANGGTAAGCWAYMDLARTAFVQVMAAWYFLANPTVGLVYALNHGVNGIGLAANPFNGKVDGLPLAYMRSAGLSTGGLKGWSTLARWTGVARTTFQDTADTLQWICVGALWLKWDGTTTPTN